MATIEIRDAIKHISNNWPLTISLLILWASITILFVISIKWNQGNFIYALDDAYIHMAISKNLLQHGVFGITQYDFTSSSSSIIWSLLLTSIFEFSGVNSMVPFTLNILFATVSIFLIYFFLKSYKMNNFYILLILVSIIFLAPLPAIIFTGMEHTLQILLVIPFVYLSANMLVKESIDARETTLLILLAIALTLVRYEDLFLVITVSVLFLMRKRIIISFELFGFALIPIIIYGIISTLNGWFFLPNSLIFKSTLHLGDFSINMLFSIINQLANQIVANPHILILIALTLLLILLSLQEKKNFWNIPTILAIIFLTTTFLHLIFANVGWFYRYEAYLVALGIFTVSVGFCPYVQKSFSNPDKSLIPKIIILSLIIIVIFSPLITRGYYALVETPQATNNIYEQSYQMGLFVKEYYNGETVAIVDVGAVNYLANIKCLDLRGLTNLDVSKHLKNGDYTSQKISEIVKQNNPSVIIVYDDLFKSYGGIPPNWIKVGEWKISNNVVCEFDTISFYTTNENDKIQLIQNLKNFSNKLPKNVEQHLFY